MKSWLPDWKNESQYINPLTISKAELAWEFLRRNPVYQNDYREWKELGDKGYMEKYLSHLIINMQGEQLIVVDAKKRGDSRTLTMLGDSYSYIMRKHGLEANIGFPNPALKFEDHLLLKFENSSFSYLEYLEDIPENKIAGLKPSRPSEIVFLLNLELPIKNTLSKVNAFAKEKQKYLKKSKKIKVINMRDRSDELYVNYLRVLDAFSLEEEPNTISSVIFPHLVNIYPDYRGYQKVTNYHNAAIKIRDHDYRYFIHLA